MAQVAIVIILGGCSFAKRLPSGLDAVQLFSAAGRDGAEQLARFEHPPVQVEALPAPALPETPEVRAEIRFFQEKNPRGLREALQRQAQYLPVIQKIFRDEGVPEVLINLAIVESGFNPAARSPVGAMGIWQFMKSTAVLYGVHARVGHDERKDPILSSLAAARHLKDLFRRYQDWHLALAAYNAGIGAVNRAINRSGSSDYWSIIRKHQLTVQTRRYVPKFIAVALIASNPQKYGFTNLEDLAQNLDAPQPRG